MRLVEENFFFWEKNCKSLSRVGTLAEFNSEWITQALKWLRDQMNALYGFKIWPHRVSSRRGPKDFASSSTTSLLLLIFLRYFEGKMDWKRWEMNGQTRLSVSIYCQFFFLCVFFQCDKISSSFNEPWQENARKTLESLLSSKNKNDKNYDRFESSSSSRFPTLLWIQLKLKNRNPRIRDTASEQEENFPSARL